MSRIAVFLLVLGVSIYLFAHYLRRAGMFFPDRYPSGRWDTTQWMIQPKEHFFVTSDGVRLHAWLVPAQRADAPLMIWFHGNGGNLTDRAEMAVELARRGVSVLLFDYRGYGRSEGKPTESGLFRDASAVHDLARKLSKGPLVLYGESLGGPYAAWLAKERNDVRGVILENSFPSLRDIGNALYAPLPLGWTAPFALRTTAWLNQAGVPVLVMHGQRDRVIPYALGLKLYEGLNVPKEMLTSHAGHCEIPIFEPDRYYGAVTGFVQRVSPRTEKDL
jgi:pimeloyl-ACP methyl ester carboxylesterase